MQIFKLIDEKYIELEQKKLDLAKNKYSKQIHAEEVREYIPKAHGLLFLRGIGNTCEYVWSPPISEYDMLKLFRHLDKWIYQHFILPLRKRQEELTQELKELYKITGDEFEVENEDLW
jgi:hypothetical protein